MAGILAICGILPPIYIHPHWPKKFAYIGLTYSTTKASKIDPQYCNNIFLAPINKKKFRGRIVPTQKRWRKDYRGSDPPTYQHHHHQRSLPDPGFSTLRTPDTNPATPCWEIHDLANLCQSLEEQSGERRRSLEVTPIYRKIVGNGLKDINLI